MRESRFTFREIEVRSLFVMIIAVFASLGINAAEQVAESTPVPEVAAPVMVYDLAPPSRPVVVAPARVRAVSEIKADKPKIVQKGMPAKSLLSRTARNQIALMGIKRLPSTVSALVFDDQDVDGDSDDLDMQCFYARPRPSRLTDQDDDQADELAQDVPDTVKLRLLMARAKAVELHQLAWQADQSSHGADEVLSDTVKLRLALARMKAVQAHEKRFS